MRYAPLTRAHARVGGAMDEATRNQVRLLSVFHYVLAGLAALFSQVEAFIGEAAAAR